jgi:hypothetical protein
MSAIHRSITLDVHTRRWRVHWPAVLGAIAATAVVALAGASPAGAAGHAGTDAFAQRNLVSDIPGVARITDPNLVNPWGLAAGPATPLWVADNGTDVSTLYSGGVR